MDGLRQRLLARAHGEGFDLAGIAAAGPARSASALDRWLAGGMHGDMAYMARTAAVRRDPDSLLAGCRSILAVAMSYRTSEPPSDQRRSGTVWVSRYAWGRDYHRIVKKRLVRLGRWLEEESGDPRWRACVDTAPILEREWAARAGLGWIGKSTMLLNRQLGSELFLGLLLTAVELEPDAPSSDHCGGCTACLDACPTGAFVAPRVLDARRCVGYLTVEHRSPIPPELVPGMGDMVAGCDRCNEACPFTRRAPADRHPEFAPAKHRKRPRLVELEALDEAGWREWRRGSTLGRIPYTALRRNLAAARRNADRHEPSTDDD